MQGRFYPDTDLQLEEVYTAEPGTHPGRLLSQAQHRAERAGLFRLGQELDGDTCVPIVCPTGQEFDGQQAGYNDVGILTAPDGRSYSIAVMIKLTGADGYVDTFSMDYALDENTLVVHEINGAPLPPSQVVRASQLSADPSF